MADSQNRKKTASSGRASSGRTASGRSASGRSGSGRSTSGTGRNASGGRSSADYTGTRSAGRPSGRPRGSVQRSTGTRGGGNGRQRTGSSDAVREDLVLIFLLAAMIFLFLSDFGIMGKAGSLISSVFFGLFGFSAYVLPVFILFLAAMYYTGRDDERFVTKLVCSIILFFCFGMICELITGNPQDSAPYSLTGIWTRCTAGKNGGGILAGSLVFLFCTFMKKVGTILVMIAVILICILMLSGQSLMDKLAGADDYGDDADDDAAGGNAPYDDRQEDVPLPEEDEPDRDSYLRIRREDKERREQERAQREEEFRRQREEQQREEELRREEQENSRILKKVDRYSGSLEETKLVDQSGMPVSSDGPDTSMQGAIPTAGAAAGAASMGAAAAGISAAGAAGRNGMAGAGAVPAAAAYSTNEDLHEIRVNDADYSDIAVRNDLDLLPTDEEPKYSGIGVPQPQDRNPDYTSDSFSNRILRQSMQETMEREQNVPAVDAEPISALDERDAAETASVKNAGSGTDEKAVEAIAVEREGSVQTAAAGNPVSQDARRTAQGSADHAAAEAPAVSARPPLPKPKVKKKYVFPPLTLLKEGERKKNPESDRELKETAYRLQSTLKTFGVDVTIPQVSQGPSVTRYELLPAQGVKVSRIVSLADDIKLNLAASDIRIEAPIPGKAAIGIEVPNKVITTVALRDLFESDAYKNFKGKMAFAVGKDIGGNVIVTDITKMPHMLIAGATGSGKSVCINTLIMSILYRYDPDTVKMIMIDPKVVELSVYNGIPHLLLPVVTDPKKAASALQWAVSEMTDRYRRFADSHVRDLKGYNEKAEAAKDPEMEVMPQIVIIVDELADLMMVSANEVEQSICRLAQLARAAGIHLIIATQRPSVDVITGLIKANMPSRLAFAVSSGVDSRTILDMNGAEKLLGKGDMLFYPQGYPKPARIQGAFISDQEVEEVVKYVKYHNPGDGSENEIEKKIESIAAEGSGAGDSLNASDSSGPDIDEHFVEAGYFIIDKDKASIGMLQRVFKIGFNRAARIMDQLCDAGVVSAEEGTKPRRVQMSRSDFESYIEENGL